MRILAATLFAASALTTLAVTGCSTGVESNAPIAGSSVRIELPTGMGSGVYIGGLIITAAHVVGDAPRCNSAGECSPDRLPTVKLISDLGDVQDGEVLWLNKAYDIAAVRPANAKRFTKATLACRDTIVGESLMAEGNPVGIPFLTFRGSVSGKPQEFLPNWKSAYVIDVTISSGMSGGPSYDDYGEVIGINVGVADPHGKQGEPASGGMGFAVPSSVVCELLGRSV